MGFFQKGEPLFLAGQVDLFDDFDPEGFDRDFFFFGSYSF